MKFLLQISLLFTLSTSALFSDDPVSKETEWENLFADDSFAKWKRGPSKARNQPEEIDKQWSIKDGVLHLDKEAEGRGGHIVTRKAYYNFDLQFEFQISVEGNSGIKYRTQDGIGCEYQVLDDEKHKDNKNPTHRTACLYELAAVPADRKLVAAGQGWNTGRIVMRDNDLEHWLNGEKVVSMTMDSDAWKKAFAESKYTKYENFARKAGPILIQDHQDTVSYRKVMIRELPRGSAPDQKKAAAVAPIEAQAEVPVAFTTNCQVCHLLDRIEVGPSMVELSELYPETKIDEFIQWCVEPGKKRDEMAQMPSMAHIPKAELEEIHAYIRKASVGVTRVRSGRIDRFAAAPVSTARPRIVRTFVPDAGPASIVVALPTENQLNLVWDTGPCRLRYLSSGVVDNWPYLRSNGNSLAKIGETIYTEKEPVFTSITEPQFRGYQISKDGLPIFHYQIGDRKITEAITLKANQLIRTITAEGDLPKHRLPSDQSQAVTTESATKGSAITITHAQTAQ